MPVEEALAMLKRGLTNDQITEELESKGYSIEQISDAINQATIKIGVETPEEEVPLPDQEMQELNIPAPEQEAQYPTYPQLEERPQDIQPLVEQIVEEKWKEFLMQAGNLQVWKAKIEDDLEATKQELLRISARFDNLQTAVIGKVKDYNQDIIELGSNVKALQKVLEKILEPLTENIKELSRITEQLKKKSK